MKNKFNSISTAVLILQLIIAMPVLASNEENNWELINDENEIQVYIYETDSSDIVKAKAKTVVRASMQIVKNKLDDIAHRHEWIPYLKQSKALTVFKNNKRIEYSHFSAPWPASDRDFVYEIELISETANQLVYKMHSVESDLMHIDPDKIRADLYESVYTLTVLDKSTTDVELIFYANPKGWLPDWIINIIQSVLPYRMLNNLKLALDE